jgi:CHAT domain-containing protein
MIRRFPILVGNLALALLAAAAWGAMATMALAAPSTAPAVFAVTPDSAGQACQAQRIYGDPLIHGDAERAYDLYCGRGDPVGRVYLLSSSRALGPWNENLGPCLVGKPLTWSISGVDNPVAVLCAGGASSTDTGGVGAPADERMSAGRGGWVVAGSALPPAAAPLDGAMRVLLGLARPGAATAAAGSDSALLVSVASALGGSAVGSSPQDFETLVAAGHEANTLWLFSQAEAYFSQAIAVHRTFWPDDKLGDADLKLELALNLSNQRRFPEARALLAEARAEAAGSPYELAKADLYDAEDRLNDESDAARLDEARKLLAQAREKLAAAHDSSNGTLQSLQRLQLLQALIWRTSARVAGADADEARRDLGAASASLAQVPNANDAWLRALVARDQARLELSQHRPQAAVDVLRAAILQLETKFPGTRLDGELYAELGRALAANGDTPGALVAYRKAFADLNAQAEASGATPDAAVAYLNLLIGQDGGKALAAGDPRGPEAFAAFEAVSGASVRQTAAAAAARLSSGADGELIRKWQDSQRATVRAEAELSRVNADSTATSADRATAMANLKAAQAAQDSLSRAVYGKEPGYATLVSGPLTLSDIQASLQPNDVLVRLLVGGDSGAGLLVKKDAVTPFTFKANAADVSALVTKIKVSARHENDAERFDLAASSQLFDALFGGVRANLLDPSQTRMILDAGGALASLPFGVLTADDPTKTDGLTFQKADWLARRFAIVVTAGLRPIRIPSGTVQSFVGYGDFTPLADDASKVGQIKAVMAARGLPASCLAPLLDAVGGLPPLAGTKAELDAIKANLGGEVRVGDQFTPDLVLADPDLSKADLVVFATHGVFRQSYADVSGSTCLPDAVLLASAPPPNTAGDMFLDTADVLRMHLSAQVAVLSACDTGNPVPVSPGETGLPSGGDALSGFARAFIYAGAQNVVITHWPIRDEFGPSFMGAFTGGLKAGQSPEVALQEAQGQAIASANYGDPYYWGAFSLVSMGLKTR